MPHLKSSAWLLLLALGACQPFRPIPPPLGSPQAGAQITAQGTVLSVERPRPEDTQSYVHLLLSPGDPQPIRLVLGPGWYLEREGIHFEPNEVVHYEGRSVTHDGKPTVEVQRIQQGEHQYVLRDPQNRPAWKVTP